MNNYPFPELKTERLFLRQLKPSDWEAISFLRSDIEVNKFVKRPAAETKEKALAFIDKIKKAFITNTSVNWVITNKGHDDMLGGICLWNFSDNRKTAEVGYDLNPKSQGKGIMDESLKCIIAYGFKTLNLDSIEAYTHKMNTASKNLLERNGFKLVIGKQDEDNLDTIIYALNNPL